MTSRAIAPVRWLAALALLVLALVAGAEVGVPPVARVTDLTGTLTAEQTSQLEQLLAAFETRKGSQIAVLMVPTTQPETIEQYAIRVVDVWKLGRKGVDDGLLLLVAKDDRKVRIEVGRGLEGAIPDAIAKRIIRDDLSPRFKAGDFAGGVQTAVIRIMGVIDGEPLPAPPEPPAGERQGEGGVFDHLEGLFVVAFILVVVVGSILRAIVGRVPAAAIVGVVAGVLAWFIVGLLIVGIIVSVIAFLFTLAGGGTGRRGRGGWSSGSSGGWSGGGWSGGGGGGGFSGGGGGFGGGGASGDW